MAYCFLSAVGLVGWIKFQSKKEGEKGYLGHAKNPKKRPEIPHPGYILSCIPQPQLRLEIATIFI
jgi:hypothetical protein